MKIKCIPKKYLTSLKQGVKNGDFDIVKMMKMTSKERRTLFEKYLSKDYAKFANTSFERALISKKEDALIDWANSVFKGERKETKPDIIDKIKKFEKQGLLNAETEDLFYEDLVSDELGFTVTQSELKKIKELTDEMQKYANEIRKTKKGEYIFSPSDKYLKARREMIDYIQSRNPSSIIKVITSSLFRTFMLASIKSPFVNIIGNTAMANYEMIKRRLQHKNLKGYNSDLVKEYISQNVKTFKKTGYDLSRTFNISEDLKILGEKAVNSQGPGRIRAMARFMENLVFKNSLGVPDVFFSSFHFADSVNLATTSLAKKEGLKGEKAKARARELMIDALSLTQSTNEGKMIREQAIKDAFYGTFTNDSKMSEFSIGMRKLLNNIHKDFAIGDQLIPFAKTPANVVYAAAKTSGVFTPIDIYHITKGFVKKDKAMIKNGISGLAAAGMGIVAAWILTELIDPDDYVSEYADYYPKERQLIASEGASYNSVKIGRAWVSLDYFGPLASAFVGIMNAKKHGNNLKEKIAKYYTGVVGQAMKVPGFNEIDGFFEGIKKTVRNLKESKYEKIKQDAENGFADYFASRVMPAILGDIAKSVDTYERKVDTPLDVFMRKIPFASKKLPEKISLFGEPVKTQGTFAPIFFGSRLKVTEENPVVDELNRLSQSNNLPSISSIEYASDRMKVLKKVMGTREFNNVLKDFGEKLYTGWDKIIKKPAYQKISDEKKRKILDKYKNRILDTTFGKWVKQYKKQFIEEYKKSK